jgi:hypothetical protein
MTRGPTNLERIRRHYTDTEIPDEEDEFRIWPPSPANPLAPPTAPTNPPSPTSPTFPLPVPGPDPFKDPVDWPIAPPAPYRFIPPLPHPPPVDDHGVGTAIIDLERQRDFSEFGGRGVSAGRALTLQRLADALDRYRRNR